MNTPRWPLALRLRIVSSTVGPIHCASGHALALEGEGPLVVSEARVLRDQRGGFFGLRFVGIAFGDGARGNAVGGKDDGQRSAVFGVGFGPSGAQVFGEGFGQERLVVPLVHEIESERQGCVRSLIAGTTAVARIESDAGARILRSEADGDDTLESFARRWP